MQRSPQWHWPSPRSPIPPVAPSFALLLEAAHRLHCQIPSDGSIVQPLLAAARSGLCPVPLAH